MFDKKKWFFWSVGLRKRKKLRFGYVKIKIADEKNKSNRFGNIRWCVWRRNLFIDF